MTTWRFIFAAAIDRKSTRLNSSHRCISYAVFCLKKIDGCPGPGLHHGVGGPGPAGVAGDVPRARARPTQLPLSRHLGRNASVPMVTLFFLSLPSPRAFNLFP